MARRALAAVPEEPTEPPSIETAETAEPHTATPPEAMPEEYLRCHAEGHWWKMAGDTGITYGPRRNVLAFTRRYVCARCSERKAISRGVDFSITYSRYTQPEGYRMDRRDKTTSTKYTALSELLHREGIDW